MAQQSILNMVILILNLQLFFFANECETKYELVSAKLELSSQYFTNILFQCQRTWYDVKTHEKNNFESKEHQAIENTCPQSTTD